MTLFSRGSAMAISLGTQSALAWLLGKEGRGEYAVCLVFTSLLTVILSFGMDWASNYSIASKKLTLNESASFSACYIFLACLIGCPLAYLLTFLPIDFFDKASPAAFKLSIFWIAALMLFNFTSAQLRGLQKFNFLAVATVFHSLFVLIGTIIGIRVLTWGVLSPIAAGITGSTLFSVVTVLWFKIKYGLSWRIPDLRKIRTELHYGMRTFWGTFGMLANAQIGTIILAFFVDQGSLGVFAVAMGFLSQIITLSDVVGSVVQPRASASEKGRPELVALCSRMVVTVSVIACLLILVFSRPLITILFSAEFLPAIPLLFILAPGIVVRSCGKSLFPYFNGIDRPGIVSVATALNLVVNTLLLMIFAPGLGLSGAALAATVGYIASTVYLVFTFIRLSRQPMTSVMIMKGSDLWLLRDFFLRKTTAGQTSYNDGMI